MELLHVCLKKFFLCGILHLFIAAREVGEEIESYNTCKHNFSNVASYILSKEYASHSST